MNAVRRIASAAVGDAAMLRYLRHDPSALARELKLTRPQVQALRSADRFFATEQPILDAPSRSTPSPAPSQALTAAFVPAHSRSTISVSADTGTLLPGAQGTVTATATTAPAPHPPAPQGPPVAPHIPPSAPQAPHVPGVPHLPGIPVAPQPPPAPQPTPTAGTCEYACHVAVVAIVANLASTATTAITAISAIAQQQCAAQQSKT